MKILVQLARFKLSFIAHSAKKQPVMLNHKQHNSEQFFTKKNFHVKKQNVWMKFFFKSLFNVSNIRRGSPEPK